MDQKRAARVSCPPPLVPAPGQYLLASNPGEPDAPLASPLFQAGLSPDGFFAGPSIPASWVPGTHVSLRGPIGHGFMIPSGIHHIALACFGGTISRLYALVETALAQNAEVVLLADLPIQDLPPAVEISPLNSLPDVVSWADYLAVDVPRAKLQPALETIHSSGYPAPAQVFIETPVPCGGMADCGVCAVKSIKGWKLACKDGPVFDLQLFLKK